MPTFSKTQMSSDGTASRRAEVQVPCRQATSDRAPCLVRWPVAGRERLMFFWEN